MPEPSDKKVRFLPFHAVNEFMTDDYRLDILRVVFTSQMLLSEERQNAIDRLCKRYIQVPGFRNAVKAPAALKVKPAAQAFQKSSEMVAGSLAAWAEIKGDLQQRVYDLLKNRSWDLLPIETDRTRLPGFITVWPKGEDFDAIQKAYAQAYPDSPASDNDIALMTVWVTGRLPYELAEAGEPEASISPEHNSAPIPAHLPTGKQTSEGNG